MEQEENYRFSTQHEMIRKLVRQFAETELTTEVLTR